MAKQSYTVKVDIHDLQDLKWTSSTDPLKVKAELPNPFVEVSVNGEVQCTQSKQNTASCSFNLTCMFRDVSLTKEQFAQSGIEVRALHKTFFSSEVIGTYFFSYESIYKRKQKSLVRQWVALTLPDRPSEPKGFARLSIAVIKSNEPMPVFDDQDADFEDLSGATSKSLMDRVMTTPELKMNYYHVLINIYKGEDFGDFSGKGSCSCGIVVRFLGVEMETVTQRDNPNPVWNVTMKLPAVVPCMESNVRLELWDFSKRPQLIDAVPLDFNEILKNGLPLQWVNFYWQPPAEGLVQQVMALADSSQKLATAYAGRLLISGSAQKAADPKPLTVSCKTQPFPPLREYRVWIDIYEISAIGQPDEVELEVCLGPLSFPLEPLRKNKSKGGGSGYVFRGDEGRLQEFRAYLPDPEMSPDLLITVRTREGWMGNRTLHSFLRVPFSRLLASVGVRPHWHNLRRVRQDDKKSQKSAAGKLLATLAAKLVGDVGDKREQRPDRAEYKLSRFLCRAFVFQASHLPVSDPHGLSDPFVRVGG
uniref:C2 domain-containing protein n=1 Tax=Chromera velia CCMP2878 TaxID=1169474 RepID=A0A0K6S6S4_9ALVE|eukprot:Cvel_17519.t1-p1 / transcript=Cvel_17519.t1 / gene=Cvel_17519 / organism=Chromera_velia_CCMP2878 / gene_product=Myoferlin, putative / transcript_product=Myoferlin, putative / location=Cvel_scaffold1404:14125-16712(+) / protein_length=532 / sequence_SO=supercontig / SO=protein_coding / is_pseudo=false